VSRKGGFFSRSEGSCDERLPIPPGYPGVAMLTLAEGHRKSNRNAERFSLGRRRGKSLFTSTSRDLIWSRSLEMRDVSPSVLREDNGLKEALRDAPSTRLNELSCAAELCVCSGGTGGNFFWKITFLNVILNWLITSLFNERFNNGF